VCLILAMSRTDSMRESVRRSKSAQARLRASFFALALTSVLQQQPAALAVAAGPEKSDAQRLSSLEDRLFEHNYPSEDDAARLHRLEQFVYGDDQSGAEGARISNLESAVIETKPSDVERSSEESPQAAQSNNAAAGQEQNNQTTSSAPAFDYGNYPRVTAIEKQLLGNTYAHDPLPERIARLETKAFGKASTSSDLGQRVDLLDQYEHRHDLYRETDIRQPLASQPQFMGQTPDESTFTPVQTNPFSPDNQMAIGTAPRTTIMETAVFGHSYPNRPLEERVHRLEKKMIPYDHNEANKNLPSRVDHLWRILSAANNLNDSPSTTQNRDSTIGANQRNAISSRQNVGDNQTNGAAETAGSQPTDGNSGHQSWLHKMSKLITSSQATPGDSDAYHAPQVYGPLGGPGTFWVP
jgi:hypothetical protein